MNAKVQPPGPVEDATVEVEEDSGGPVPSLPVNLAPASLYSQSMDFIMSNGWYILIGMVILVYLYHKYAKHYVNRFWEKYEERSYYKKFDRDTVEKRNEAMEQARIRMQSKHDALASVWADKEKQKQEQLKLEKLEEWERHQRGEGYRSKTRAPGDAPTDAGASNNVQAKKGKKNVLRRDDYNPLIGSTSGPSCTFRPGADRGGAAGGG